jgi:hypothetical protein
MTEGGVAGGCDPRDWVGGWHCFELDAAGGVHEDEDEIAGLKGVVDLLQHPAVKLGAGLVDTGGVDKDDLGFGMSALDSRDLDHSGNAVAGGLRLGSDDGYLFAGKGVE